MAVGNSVTVVVVTAAAAFDVVVAADHSLRENLLLLPNEVLLRLATVPDQLTTLVKIGFVASVRFTAHAVLAVVAGEVETRVHVANMVLVPTHFMHDVLQVVSEMVVLVVVLAAPLVALRPTLLGPLRAKRLIYLIFNGEEVFMRRPRPNEGKVISRAGFGL